MMRLATFIGVAAGNFACGRLGDRIGSWRTVLLTEISAAALILDVRVLPLQPAIVLLPILGVMLNGTSSVLHGTVPELSAPDRTARVFALFYTGTIGSGAGAPVLYGFLGDACGPATATAATGSDAAYDLSLHYRTVTTSWRRSVTSQHREKACT